MKSFMCYYDETINQISGKNEPTTKDYQLCYAMLGFNKVLLNDDKAKKMYEHCLKLIEQNYSISLDFIIKVTFDRYTNQPVSLNDYAFLMNLSGKDPINMKELYKIWMVR